MKMVVDQITSLDTQATHTNHFEHGSNEVFLRVLINIRIVLRPKLLCISSFVSSTGSSYGRCTAHKNVGNKRWIFEATRLAPKIACKTYTAN